jgi:hypothetical protein
MMNTVKLFNRWTVVASLAILAACGGGGGGGGISVPVGTNNTIVATPSPSGPISVAVGQSPAFSVTFTTSDGKTATNFSITSGLSTLPAGWTGPTSLACASVSTGSGCMANLTFTPTAASTGAVTLNYSYVNNAGTSKTGTATVSYASTSNDSVVATPSPKGAIAVVTGGRSTVGITFTTDDGAMATGLSITSGLSALPAGWSGPATFACASVSTGSGCVLNVTYAPTAIASGTLMLSYKYNNNSGTAKTGSISIAYSATAQNHVIATTTPAGQIVAVIGGAGQTVKVDFTTDDTNPASNLAVTPANLTSLPAGWTGPATFTCKTVSTGNGCELSLNYAPTTATSGTVTLNFGYTNNSGVAATGTVKISYAASADNTVIPTQSPSGTVNAVVGAGSQAVKVTFNSSDSNPVSNVAITSGLGASLPTGWTGPATFTCVSASNTGNACQLSLAYAPLAAASGSLQLNYSFKAHSGTTKTGSVTILYVATTHNVLGTTQAPSGTIGAVVNSGSVPVTLTFTTNDGNPATAVTITSGLSTLSTSYPGWSGPATFSCASASTGTGCQLMLTYTPTVNGNGSVALGYSYVDNSGTPQTGTASIAYASIPGFLYITDLAGNVSSCAVSGVNGSVSSCTIAASGFSAAGAPTGIAFSGNNWVYITPGAAATDVEVCPVNTDGTLGCTGTIANTFVSGAPDALAVSGGYLYVADANNPTVYNCPINSVGGSLGVCNPNSIGTVDTLDGIAVTATNAYMVDINGANLSTCTVSSINGSLSACTQQTLIGTDPGNTLLTTAPRSTYVYGGNLYVGTGAGTLILPISTVDGTVTVNYPCSTAIGTSCTIEQNTPAQSAVFGFAFNNGYAYASGFGAFGIGICKIEASGILDNCATSPQLSAFYYGGIAVH